MLIEWSTIKETVYEMFDLSQKMPEKLHYDTQHTTFSLTTLSIMTFSMTILSIMTFSITTLSITFK